MGVGYCASPLHRITHLDTSAMTSRPPVKGSSSTLDSVAEELGANVGQGSVPLYSPTVESLLTWRDRVATKYRDQLEEDLTWDESSTFEVSEGWLRRAQSQARVPTHAATCDASFK
jgi:hypothetical protein